MYVILNVYIDKQEIRKDYPKAQICDMDTASIMIKDKDGIYFFPKHAIVTLRISDDC